MKKKDLLDKIAGTLGLNAEEFAKVTNPETEELEITFPEGRFLTKDQEEQLLDNHGKKRYDAGSEAAREMQLKDMSKLVGFEESIKDPQKFIDKLKENILEEAKIEPNKKVQQLETSLETLRNTIKDKDTAYQQLESSLKNMKTRSKLLDAIPKLADNGLKRDEVLDLFLRTYEVKEDGVYNNGQVLQDNLAKNRTVEDVISSFVTDRGWDFKENPKGRGKNPKPNGSPVTFEDYETEIKEKGIHPGSQEAQALLKTYVEQNPEFLN